MKMKVFGWIVVLGTAGSGIGGQVDLSDKITETLTAVNSWQQFGRFVIGKNAGQEKTSLIAVSSAENVDYVVNVSDTGVLNFNCSGGVTSSDSLQVQLTIGNGDLTKNILGQVGAMGNVNMSVDASAMGGNAVFKSSSGELHVGTFNKVKRDVIQFAASGSGSIYAPDLGSSIEGVTTLDIVNSGTGSISATNINVNSNFPIGLLRIANSATGSICVSGTSVSTSRPAAISCSSGEINMVAKLGITSANVQVSSGTVQMCQSPIAEITVNMAGGKALVLATKALTGKVGSSAELSYQKSSGLQNSVDGASQEVTACVGIDSCSASPTPTPSTAAFVPAASFLLVVSMMFL
uniref:Adhesin domain-containing protein n=1 Tax=Mucochytrium quahogii TaxID=96639 RepID=A0A7S2W6D3_9STRA|mmetsp:Transcript_3028/g.4334  ORF Transcript_3028/g.4334 Transcript_3028/m.4334 type:complete len:350 (-) Transcript_3028:96-1145(-)